MHFFSIMQSFLYLKKYMYFPVGKYLISVKTTIKGRPYDWGFFFFLMKKRWVWNIQKYAFRHVESAMGVGDLLNITFCKIGWILIGCQCFYHPSNLTGSDPNGVETVASVVLCTYP